MARTQATELQIKDRVLTGASFTPEMKFYDETYSYVTNDQIFWQGEQYTCNTNIIGGAEGDLSNAPDVSPNWDLNPNMVYTVSPSAADSIGTGRTDIVFDTENISSPYCSLSGAGEIKLNADGVFLVSYSIGSENTGSTARASSNAFLQLNGTDVPNANINLYNRDTTNGKDSGTCTVALNLTSGDLLKVQMTASAAVIDTLPGSCNITIFGLDTISGPQGPIGLTGPSGDLRWLGVWSAGTYNQYDTVEYQGTSYTCLLNGTTSTPGTNLGTEWDIVALKGSDGAGATLTVQDDGANIPNTPHGTLNFRGFDIQDAGAGVANIYIIDKTIARCTNDSEQVFNDTAVAIQLANISSTTEVTQSGTTFTINKDGRYNIRAKVNIADNSTTRCNPFCYFELNGAQDDASKTYMYSRNTSDGNSTAVINTTRDLTTGDVIEFYVQNNKTSNVKTITNESSFEIEYQG